MPPTTKTKPQGTLTVGDELPGVELGAVNETYIKLLLHGESGSGKTWFLASFSADPRTAPLLLLDATEGSVGVRKMGMIGDGSKVYGVTNDKSIMQYLDWVLAHPGVFKTIALDDFTEVFNQIRISVAKEMGTTPDKITDAQNASFSITCYERARRIWRKLKQIAKPVAAGGGGAHVVVTCWSKKGINPRTRDEQYVPHLAGAFGFETPGYFDIVASIGAEVKKVKGEMVWRNVMSTRDPKFFIKDRFDVVRSMSLPTATKLLDRLDRKGSQDEPTQEADDVEVPAPADTEADSTNAANN